MAQETKEKKKIIHKLKSKYRLIMYNDQTFEEVWYLRLSRLNVLSVVGTLTIIIITLITLLIAFTPIREIIPGYPDAKFRSNIFDNALKVDSLVRAVKLRDQYIENINNIISGKEPQILQGKQDTSTKQYRNINFNKSFEDSLLRHQIEEEEQYNFSVEKPNNSTSGIVNLIFFPPLKGIVTNSINQRENHFGTDIVASPNEPVKATLDGTVIEASWTLETGYVIAIQHANNLLSIYKHNANLLKKVGDPVTAGEPIAIIGNSGELSTGPHLHFELWYNGKPLNPEEYIVF